MATQIFSKRYTHEWILLICLFGYVMCFGNEKKKRFDVWFFGTSTLILEFGFLWPFTISEFKEICGSKIFWVKWRNNNTCRCTWANTFIKKALENVYVYFVEGKNCVADNFDFLEIQLDFYRLPVLKQVCTILNCIGHTWTELVRKICIRASVVCVWSQMKVMDFYNMLYVKENNYLNVFECKNPLNLQNCRYYKTWLLKYVLH